MPEQPSTLTPRQISSRAWYAANKSIKKEKNRAYYAANKDAIKDTQRDKSRAYRKANPEKSREWCEANKERKAEIKRVWHAANPEYGREWCEANPEALRNKKAKRNAVPGEITPGWIPKLLELQRWTCIVCQKDLRYGYHIDHIEPIARGGENTDFNVQALCPKCNLEKSDKDPILFMQSRGFLL